MQVTVNVNVCFFCILCVGFCCLPEGYNDAILHRSVQLKKNVISHLPVTVPNRALCSKWVFVGTFFRTIRESAQRNMPTDILLVATKCNPFFIFRYLYVCKKLLVCLLTYISWLIAGLAWLELATKERLLYQKIRRW